MLRRASGVVKVLIEGDAKSLIKATRESETAVSGLSKKLLGGAALLGGGLIITDAVVDFGAQAVKQADRVGDAFGRLEDQLGPELAKKLRARADDFHEFGASEGDMLELEARLTDIGKAAGVANPDLAEFAEQGAAIASAMEGATEIPADEWIAKIGKAASSGDMRSLRDLGIFLDDAAVNARALADTGKPTVDALTETEKATARFNLILENLDERYGNAADAAGDLEGKQRDLGAQIETLQGKIGDAVDGPLTDFLDIILTIIDRIEWSITVLDAMGVGLDELATPLARAADGFRTLLGSVDDVIAGMNELLGLWSTATGAGIVKGSSLFLPSSGSNGGRRATSSTVNVNVQGGSPEVIEQSVRNAVNSIVRRQGQLE